MSTTFQKPGKFYKGNIHGHSTVTDGALSPAEVVEAYRNKGYDFISLTDHFMPEVSYETRPNWQRIIADTTEFRSNDFTTIIGAEIHAPNLLNGEIWHLVAVGLPVDWAEIGPDEQGIDIARRAYEAGAFVGIAHPAWYTLTVAETLPLLHYSHAIEVYNTGCSGGGRADSWYFADELFTMGHRLHAYAADDSHRVHPIGAMQDAFGGWVQVKSESLDPDSLLAALKAGDYYSSTGPEFEDIQWQGDVLRIQSSPVDRYYISGKGARTRAFYGGNLTECEVPLDSATREASNWGDYVRVTAIDAENNKAWSQPIWLTDPSI